MVIVSFFWSSHYRNRKTTYSLLVSTHLRTQKPLLSQVEIELSLKKKGSKTLPILTQRRIELLTGPECTWERSFWCQPGL